MSGVTWCAFPGCDHPATTAGQHALCDLHEGSHVLCGWDGTWCNGCATPCPEDPGTRTPWRTSDSPSLRDVRPVALRKPAPEAPGAGAQLRQEAAEVVALLRAAHPLSVPGDSVERAIDLIDRLASTIEGGDEP